MCRHHDRTPAQGARPDVRLAWISEPERKLIRKAMIEVNISRGLRGEPSLTEPPPNAYRDNTALK